jgi:hypothetical protein
MHGHHDGIGYTWQDPSHKDTMNQLLPIPPDSRMAADIARMESVLRALRGVVAQAGPDALARFSAHDASRGGGGVAFSDLFTSGEARYDWQEFYHYYAIEKRDKYAAEYGPLTDYRGPQWVKFSTEDRLLWVQLIPKMLEALAGQNVHVMRDTSWRWDRHNPRPGGQARYVPVYQAMVSLPLGENAPFAPEAVLPELLQGICTADNPLADVHLLDWMQDTLGSVPVTALGWTPDGLRARFSNEADLDTVREKLFSDYPCVKGRIGEGRTKDWLLSVDLRPAAVPAT